MGTLDDYLASDKSLKGIDASLKGIDAKTTFGQVKNYLTAMGFPTINTKFQDSDYDYDNVADIDEWSSGCTLIGGTEDKDIASTVIRRRLSPGETFLKNLRRVKPYRDSPVLTRLLKEIRELNQQ